MADVVALCAAREVRTPTQYVARWTEVAAVARQRGHLTGRTELSFDAAADVDAARPALEEALCGAIAAEKGCGEEPARERTRELVGALELVARNLPCCARAKGFGPNSCCEGRAFT